MFPSHDHNPYDQVYDLFSDPVLAFWIAGREIAPNTGTVHIQGYIETLYPVRFSRIQSLFPGAHIEKARGNRSSNIKYCSKDGDYRVKEGFENSYVLLDFLMA